MSGSPGWSVGLSNLPGFGLSPWQYTTSPPFHFSGTSMRNLARFSSPISFLGSHHAIAVKRVTASSIRMPLIVHSVFHEKLPSRSAGDFDPAAGGGVGRRPGHHASRSPDRSHRHRRW